MKKIFYLITNIIYIPRFIFDYLNFKYALQKKSGWTIKFLDSLPILHERTASIGFDSHYVYHTSWAARALKEIAPSKHIDISSSIMFCGIASAYTSIEHYDYRQPNLNLSNLKCGTADLLNLPFLDSTVSSLSCMHVVEHIGLGRYGDKINPDGDWRACNELIRVLKDGGYLLFVVPVAEVAMIRFNGHRIYTLSKVMSMFKDLTLIEFSFFNEKKNTFIRNANDKDVAGSIYGCGCFIFKK
jgi:hypothetical protein